MPETFVENPQILTWWNTVSMIGSAGTSAALIDLLILNVMGTVRRYRGQ